MSSPSSATHVATRTLLYPRRKHSSVYRAPRKYQELKAKEWQFANLCLFFRIHAFSRTYGAVSVKSCDTDHHRVTSGTVLADKWHCRYNRLQTAVEMITYLTDAGGEIRKGRGTRK